MKLNIVNHTNDANLKVYYSKLRYYFRKTLKYLKMDSDYELSLVLVDQVEIRDLNRNYRQKDYETDVLSFASQESLDGFVFNDACYLGDIVINIDRVYHQASEYKHSIEREFCFLFVHGLLHCLGYDHETYAQEEEMFKLQKVILGALK